MMQEFPEMLVSPVEMSEPNLPILIYDGEFEIRNTSKTIKITGKIEFNWLPNIGPHFQGITSESKSDINTLASTQNDNEIYIDGLMFSKCFVTLIQFRNSDPSIIRGISHRPAIIGDKSINVTSVSFSIPNLRSLDGEAVKNTTTSLINNSRSRIQLIDKKYNITIDKLSNFNNLSESLNAKGGYLNLYTGELTKKTGAISFTEAKEIFICLNTFLTFINGRRTSALFLNGKAAASVSWVDHSTEFVDIYKHSSSWTTSHSSNGICSMWERFVTLWEDDKDFLSTAIHWYIEANKNTGLVEGATIMAQTALELLYNWLVIENKKLLVGNDAREILATNKIRLLLSVINADTIVTPTFSELLSYINGSPNINDGPDAIVAIRNAIVHSQESKRKELSLISEAAKYEALQLSIWYIEISLLSILGYSDNYYNRCTRNTEPFSFNLKL